MDKVTQANAASAEQSAAAAALNHQSAELNRLVDGLVAMAEGGTGQESAPPNREPLAGTRSKAEPIPASPPRSRVSPPPAPGHAKANAASPRKNGNATDW